MLRWVFLEFIPSLPGVWFLKDNPLQLVSYQLAVVKGRWIVLANFSWIYLFWKVQSYAVVVGIASDDEWNDSKNTNINNNDNRNDNDNDNDNNNNDNNNNNNRNVTNCNDDDNNHHRHRCHHYHLGLKSAEQNTHSWNHCQWLFVPRWSNMYGSEMENLDGSSLYLRIWMGFVIYYFHHTEYWSVSMFRFFVLCDLNCCKVLLNSFFLLGLILHSYEIDSHLFCRSMYHPLNWIFFFNSWIGWWFPHFVRIRVLFCSEKRRYRKVSFPKIIPQWCWPDSIPPVREPLFPLSNSWNSESGIL